MKKRFISCYSSEIKKMSSKDLKNSIVASEGRVILAETVVTAAPLVEGVTNAEVMVSFGADLLLLNEYDVFTKYINGIENIDNPIGHIKDLTGRPVGINLEPVDNDVNSMEDIIEISKG